MLEASISSTHHICRFWGLIGREGETAREVQVDSEPAMRKLIPLSASTAGDAAPASTTKLEAPNFAASDPTKGVGKVIEDALRAAGLMR